MQATGKHFPGHGGIFEDSHISEPVDTRSYEKLLNVYERTNKIKEFEQLINQSIDNLKKKILSIGDNLNTDIRGANVLNYHSLLISNGVHREEIKDKGVEEVSKQYEVIVNYLQSDLKW